MNRCEFIFGSVACAMMPCAKGNDKHAVALSDVDIANINDIVKCRNDIVYFAEKYIKVHTTQKGHFNVELKDWQKKYLMHLATGKDAVLDAYRQSRKTTTNLIYAVWKTMFKPYQKITLVTCNKRMSESIFDVIETMYDNLPDWMKSRDYENEHYMHDKKHIRLKNGSELVVTYANADFCGYCPGSILIVDEFAFFTFEQYQNMSDTIIPVAILHKDVQLIIASTPSAADNKFSRYVNELKNANAPQLFEITKS